MKFVAAAATTALLASSVTANATTLTGKQLKNNPKFASKLLQDAKPYIQRQLDDGFEINGDYSILFHSCESLTIQADFENDGDDATSYQLQNMYSEGTIKAQKSYILFDVCPTQYCNTNNGDYRTTYITDMASFINAFAEFIPTKQQEYCEGCQENADYCQYNQYSYNNANNAGNGQQQQQQQNYNGDGNYNNYNYNNNGGGRFLEENQVYEYIDCDRCTSYQCYNNNNNNNGGNDGNDYSLEWIEQMTECAASDYPTYYNGNSEVRWGFMCNEEGTGVEVAAFLDEDCTLYTNQVAFSDNMGQSDYNYYSGSKEYIEYMFSTGFSCYNPEVTYINPYDEAAGAYADDNNGGDNQDNNNGDYNAPEAAEWCQGVFESDMDVVAMTSCGYNNNNNNNNNNGNQNQNQNQQGDGNYNDGYYQQYYTLAEEDADDGYSVCAALTNMGGTGEHLYEKSGSGSVYSYQNKNKKQSSDNWEEQMDAKKSVNVSAVAGWLLAALVVVGVGAAFFMKFKNGSANGDKKTPILSTDEKGELA